MRLARIAQSRAERRRKRRVAQPAEQDAPNDQKTEVGVAAEGEVNEVLDHGEARADQLTQVRGFAPGEPAFEGLDVARTPQGLAVLGGSLGHLECEPAGCIDSADHHIFLARVTGGSLARDEKPMVHVRKSGLKY